MALYSQTELVNIVPSNSGSIVFSFSTLPETISSELSDDKKRIAITLANTSVATKLRDELPTTDRVEHISVQQKEKNLTVYIVLRERYGFTQVALPYSRTLQVSIVDWEKLSQRDNLYHSGLLSLDSKLPETALDYLQQAMQKGSGNAAAIAGLIALRNGDITQAQTNFTRALDIGTSIHDVYAAIADIAAARGDTQRAQHFAQLFTRKTHLPTFPSLVPAILANQTEVLEPRTLAEGFLSEEQQIPVVTADSLQTDTSNGLARDSLVNKQVENQAQALITGVERAERETPPSLVPSWMQWTVYAFLFVFCSSLVGTFYLYFRWRKKRLRTQATTDSPPSSAFEQEMATAMQMSQAQKATALYKQAEEDNKQEQEGESEEEGQQEHIPTEHLSLANRQDSDEFQENDELHKNNEQQSRTPSSQEIFYDHQPFQPSGHAEEVDTLARKLRKGRGELDFAVKLLARKKQDGQNKALAISVDDIPEKPSHLARLAQKLGIGAGLLEMRRQLGTAIQEDKEEKLRSLFSARDRDK